MELKDVEGTPFSTIFMQIHVKEEEWLQQNLKHILLPWKCGSFCSCRAFLRFGSKTENCYN